MVIIYKRLNIRKIVVNKINKLIYHIKEYYGVEAIYFNNSIDGLTYFNMFPHYDDKTVVSDWYSKSISASTLLKVIKCLESKDFHMFYTIDNNKTVKLVPRKNV